MNPNRSVASRVVTNGSLTIAIMCSFLRGDLPQEMARTLGFLVGVLGHERANAAKEGLKAELQQRIEELEHLLGGSGSEGK